MPERQAHKARDDSLDKIIFSLSNTLIEREENVQGLSGHGV
jgi:hypothetical protein